MRVRPMLLAERSDAEVLRLMASIVQRDVAARSDPAKRRLLLEGVARLRSIARRVPLWTDRKETR